MQCPPRQALTEAALTGLANAPSVLNHVADCDACTAVLATLARAQPASEPSTVGRYVILGELGRGAFGRVVEAYDPELDRTVALKLIDAETSPATVRGLLREAQAMARVDAPHVVAVYDAGYAGGTAFVAMRLVRGETLRARLARGPLPVPEALAVFGQVCSGVAAIHDARTIHRDLKPDNILLAGDAAFVSDFGLATSDGEPGRDHDDVLALPDARHGELTLTRSFAGTPAYMAPELLAGAAPNARSDQYAVGVALYEALTGTRPFGGETLRELVAAQRAPFDTTPLVAAGVPGHVVRALRRALAVEPADRFSSAKELARGLDPRRTHRRRLLAIAIAATTVILTGAVIAGATWRDHATDDARAACERDANRRDVWWSDAREHELRAHLVGNAAVAQQGAAMIAKLTRLNADARALDRAACDAPSTATTVMACTGAVGARADAFVSAVIETPTVELTTALIAQASGLSVRMCADGAYARRFTGVTDPAARAQLAEFFRAFQTIEQLFGLGSARGAAAARATLDAALRASPEPLRAYRRALAEAVFARGELRNDDEIREARFVIEHAPAGADPYSHAMAWVLLHDGLIGKASSKEAAVAEIAASQALEEVGSPPELVGLFAFNSAIAAGIAGDDAAYFRSMERARGAFATLGDEAAMAGLDQTLASQALAKGDAERARVLLAGVEPVLRRWYGESSASYLDFLDTTREVAQYQGHDDEALAIAERAIAIARRTGAEPEHLFGALIGYAKALGRNGRTREAGAAAREAIATGAFAPDHPFRIEGETLLAMAEAADGSFAAAAVRLRAQAALVRAQPIPMTLSALTQLGQMEETLGRRDHAIAAYREALAFGTELHDEPMVVTASLHLASVLVELHRDDEAGPLLDHVLPCAGTAAPPMVCAMGHAAAAELQARAGDRVTARDHAARALELAKTVCPGTNVRTKRECTRLIARAAPHAR